MHQTFPGDDCLHPSKVKVLKLDDPQNERLNEAMMILMPAKSPPHVVYAAQWVADKLQCCMQGMFNEARHHVHPYSVHFTEKVAPCFLGQETSWCTLRCYQTAAGAKSPSSSRTHVFVWASLCVTVATTGNNNDLFSSILVQLCLSLSW